MPDRKTKKADREWKRIYNREAARGRSQDSAATRADMSTRYLTGRMEKELKGRKKSRSRSTRSR